MRGKVAFIVQYGLPLGFSQRLVLRRRIPEHGAWIIATTAGCGAAWFLALVIAFYQRSAGFGPRLLLSSTTVLIGLAQTLALRPWTRSAGLWVVASALSWMAAVGVVVWGGFPIDSLDRLPAPLLSRLATFEVSNTGFGTALVGGLVAGGLTGIALAWTCQDFAGPERGA
jgi:hypothetical protein